MYEYSIKLLLKLRLYYNIFSKNKNNLIINRKYSEISIHIYTFINSKMYNKYINIKS